MRTRNTPDSLFSGLPESVPAASGPDFRFEQAIIDRNIGPVAGLDEAGRGPLAGPVVAACVVLDPACIPPGLNDSKALGAPARERLFEAIVATSHVAVASTSPQAIDRTNIRLASLDCMRRALLAISVTPAFALVDGRDIPQNMICPARALVKGDARSLSIAAASIIAKVTRDRMMIRADQIFPGYGFASHMGYGTRQHLEAIATLGACPLHRMSFRPLRTD